MALQQQTEITTRKLLLIKHSKGWDVDRVNRWAERRGHIIERCFPADGDPFPDAKDFDGVVVFGGAMSANDCGVQPWIKPELAFIEQCLSSKTKFFGICLGAQLLARTLGAKISPLPCGATEVGFYPLEPVDNSGFLETGDNMFQWHSEGFELPPGATALARSKAFPQQAYSLPDGHYGVQFHPEVNPDVLKLWHKRIPADKYQWLTEEVRQQHIQLCEEYDQRITTWLDAFLDNWIAHKS